MQSAVSYGRVFVVEVMGGNCGYLGTFTPPFWTTLHTKADLNLIHTALMSAISTGAELVYLPESGITLSRLMEDCQLLVKRSH